MINRTNNQYMRMILAKHNKKLSYPNPMVNQPTPIVEECQPTECIGRIEVVTIPTSGIVVSDGKQYINKCCFNAINLALMNTNSIITSKISALQIDVSPITLMRVANFPNDDEMINTDNVTHYVALCKVAEYLNKLDVRIHVYIGIKCNNKWYTNPTTDIIFGHGQHVIRIMNQIIYHDGESIGVHFEAISGGIRITHDISDVDQTLQGTLGVFQDDIVNMEHLIETQKEMEIIIHNLKDIPEVLHNCEDYPDINLLLRQQQIEMHELNMQYQRDYQQLKHRHICERMKYEATCELRRKKRDEQLAKDEEFARQLNEEDARRAQLEEDEVFAKKLELEINR